MTRAPVRHMGQVDRPLAPVIDLPPAYWRLLVSRVPQIAADRLARDIRSGHFTHDHLLARAQDLSNHARARVRERAASELLPALEEQERARGA